MAGRRHEEEEECEDCKLQTILRVNIFAMCDGNGDDCKLWTILLVNFSSVFMCLTYCCFQNIPLGTLSTSEQEIANECFSGSLNALIQAD